MSQQHLDPRSRTSDHSSEALFRSESVRDVLTLLYKRRGLYWIVFLSFMLSLVWLSKQVEPTYKAHASVEFLARLESTMSNNVDNPSSSRYRPMPLTDVNSQIELMKSREVLMGAVENPEVYLLPPYQNMPDWENKETSEKILAWRNYLKDRFEIEGVPTTTVAHVTVSDWGPKRAALLADHLAESFIRHRTRNFLAESNIEIYDDALVSATEKYEAASRTLDVYRTDNQIQADPSAQVDRLMENRSSLFSSKTRADAEYISAKTRRDKIAHLVETKDPMLITMSEIVDNTTLKNRSAEISAAKKGLEEFLQHNLETHPQFDRLLQDILSKEEQYQVSLDATYRALVFTEETTFAQKEAEVGIYEGQIQKLSLEITRISALATQLDRINVEFESAREAFRLAKKRRDDAVTISVTTPEFKAKVTGHAIVMNEPSFPPPIWMVWILAVFGGFFFGLTSIFIAGYLDRSLDTPGSAERELGIPVLATIQDERIKKSKKGRIGKRR